MRINRQSIALKNVIDGIRDEHESIKYLFYSVDNSKGAKLLMKDTEKIGRLKGRYLSPEMMEFRRSIFEE